MIQNDMRAKAAFRHRRVIKRIDEAEPIIEHICQAHCRKRPAFALHIFDHPAFHWRFLDHRREFKDIHIRHATIRMPCIQIAAEQRELILGRPGAAGIADQVCIAAQQLAMRARRREIRHADAR